MNDEERKAYGCEEAFKLFGRWSVQAIPAKDLIDHYRDCEKEECADSEKKALLVDIYKGTLPK